MNTKEWFAVCKPNPTLEQACIQIGVHMEEFAEMLEALGEVNAAVDIQVMASRYKNKRPEPMQNTSKIDKTEMLDSIAYQAVTGQGVCHTLGMDFDGALKEVERSNSSKLEDGKPVFDENGKIAKGESYSPPDLKPYI